MWTAKKQRICLLPVSTATISYNTIKAKLLYLKHIILSMYLYWIHRKWTKNVTPTHCFNEGWELKNSVLTKCGIKYIIRLCHKESISITRNVQWVYIWNHKATDFYNNVDTTTAALVILNVAVAIIVCARH